MLCSPEEKLCSSCTIEERGKLRSKVRSLLKELPWLRHAEINKHIPCSPYLVNSIRAGMVQEMASKVTLEELDSLKAETLVMLYKCLPPEQLNHDVVARTIYSLRKDLARGKEFKPVRRYDIIPRGKGKKDETARRMAWKRKMKRTN